MRQGDVISYPQMCNAEEFTLQRGMNFRLPGGSSVILMSVRRGAPYADRVDDDGRTLIYEGHDAPATAGGPDPKSVDQPKYNDGGSLSQNGLFYEAAHRTRRGEAPPELVKVYEKIATGIWVYNGIFLLLDAHQEPCNGRQVFKFKLALTEDSDSRSNQQHPNLDHSRIIPSSVKREVWRRDKGRCVECGSTNNLHFDHIIPYSKGGTSLTADNIQLLCARHNLEKHDQIR